jgi:hypothetical protein
MAAIPMMLASPGNKEWMDQNDQRTTVQPGLSMAEPFGHVSSKGESR